ncbi:MAG: Arm DNA-binding domain-containing protein, partial [Thermoguttaceae bacterium]
MSVATAFTTYQKRGCKVMAENKFKFTPARLEKLKPGAKTTMYYDVGTPLALWVTPGGAKTFCVYRRVNGRPSRVRIGRVGDVALGDARKAAQKLLGEVASGADPGAERAASRKQPTMEALWGYWFEHHARPHKKT